MAADKQHVHELIDQLPPSQVPAAIDMLESLLDPVSRAIANAPVDDEPLTPEDEKALAEARESSKSGKWIPHEEVLAEFGLTPEDVDMATACGLLRLGRFDRLSRSECLRPA